MNILGLNISRAATPADLVIEAEAQRGAYALTGPAAEFQGGDGRVVSLGELAPRRTSTGVSVTEEGSLAVAAVFKSVRVLSESVASLPLKLYRRDGRARTVASDHPLYSVLHDQGNDLMTAMKLREVMMAHLCLWGNFFGEVQRDGRGAVAGIVPVHPARVTVRVVEVGGRLRFAFDVDGGATTLTHDECFHVAGLGTGLLGKSPIQLHREGLGVSVSAERYGAAFFANDATPGFVLSHPGELGDVAYGRIKSHWEQRHQGAGNAHKVAILEEGMKPETVGLPPEDAQFIETRVFQAREVYGIYRVPPHKVGDLERATFSNIEHQGIEFVQDALLPYMVRIEQAVRSQLLTREERRTLFAAHVVDGLLRGDIASRYDAYTKGRNWGWLSVNDIRSLENMNPVENGDVYLQPLNMVEAGSDPMGEPAPAEPGGDGAARSLPAGEGASPVVEARALPTRYQEAKALEALLRDMLGRAVSREVREIGEAVGRFLASGDRDGFRDWVSEFTTEHEAWLQRRSLPAFQAMADAMVTAARDELGAAIPDDAIDGFVREYVAAFASRHAGATRGQMLKITEEAEDPAEAVTERLDEWEADAEGPTRAEKDARRERQRASNAMTAAAWAVVGIARGTWRAVGKSCPYCNELDGQSRRLGTAFLASGESIEDLEASSDVGHPPLHDGCDCILMPGGGARSATPAEVREVWDGLIVTAGGTVGPCRHEPIDARNAYIRGVYPGMVQRIGMGPALAEIEEHVLSRAESDGWPPIGQRQIRRIGAASGSR